MPRIGLVLGAGGVVGHAYHAGTLAGLVEATGWDPRTAEIIVGTSAGSGMGATLRGGIGARDLYARIVGGRLSAEGSRLYARLGAPVELPPFRPGLGGRVPAPASPAFLLRSALRPWATRPGTVLGALLPAGRYPTEVVGSRVRGLFEGPWADEPLWICAVRLDTGRRVVFGRDPSPSPDVATAVEASSAIPGFFAPVVIDGTRYIDGGAHSPSNADLPAGLGLDLVVVVSPMSTARRALGAASVAALGRAMHSRALAAEVATVRAAGTPVVVFHPGSEELTEMGLNAMDPRRREPVARKAREVALGRIERTDLAARLAPLRAS